MTVKIEVTDDISNPRKAGDNSVREQKCYVQLPSEKYPQITKLSIWEGNDPLQAGVYTFDPAGSLFIGQYDQVQFRLRAEDLKKSSEKPKGGE